MASYVQQNKQRGSAIIIILTVIVLLLVAGAIVYVLLSKNKDGSLKLPSIGFMSTTAKTPSEVTALITNAKAGKFDVQCTYTDKTTGEGTIYIKGAKKMRVDTTLKEKPGHILRLEDAGYVWADGQTEGSKLPFTNESKYSPESFASKVEEDHVVCHSVASLSESLFTLPSGVKFVDINNYQSSSSSN